MRILLIITALATGNATFAQDESAALSTFHDFFGAFVDDEWTCHTHMRGPDGATVFEGEDVRTYRYGMRDRYVIENVYNESGDGTRMHVGLQLLGVDLKTGELSISQFWPWQPTLLGDVRAHLAQGDHGEWHLRGAARPAGQDYPVFNFGCAFENENRYICNTVTRSKDGAEFHSNTETCTRR